MAELWGITVPLKLNGFEWNLEFRLRKMCLIKCIRKIPNPSLENRTLEPQSSYVTFAKIIYPSQQLISSGAKKKGKLKTQAKLAAHHSHSSLFLFAAAEMIRCWTRPLRFINTPYSGLPIKGATLSHKIHLHYFSENRRHATNNLCHVD